ncbi:MAG TPA: hypothetical protein VJ204_14915 [Solirubrobacterales bacterium]|nr:hypothetical protein [Solirubrobacterales bacterium]
MANNFDWLDKTSRALDLHLRATRDLDRFQRVADQINNASINRMLAVAEPSPGLTEVAKQLEGPTFDSQRVADLLALNDRLVDWSAVSRMTETLDAINKNGELLESTRQNVPSAGWQPLRESLDFVRSEVEEATGDLEPQVAEAAGYEWVGLLSTSKRIRVYFAVLAAINNLMILAADETNTQLPKTLGELANVLIPLAVVLAESLSSDGSDPDG